MIAADILRLAGDPVSPPGRWSTQPPRAPRAPLPSGAVEPSPLSSPYDSKTITTDGPGRRRKRSRSSPARNRSSSPECRARSPSVGTLRRLPAPPAPVAPPTPTPRASHLPSAATILSSKTHSWLKQRSSVSYNSAFYSTRPPAEPLRLVSSGEQSPVDPLLQLSDNSVFGSADKHYAPASPKFLVDGYNAIRNSTQIHKYTKVEESVPSKSKEKRSTRRETRGAGEGQRGAGAGSGAGRMQRVGRVVAQLLNELVAALPLHPSASKYISLNQSSRLPYYGVDRRKVVTRLSMAAAAEATVSPRCRSVAVQASTAGKRKNNSADSKSFVSVDSKPSDGWVGGVRALRDSHVRLVLRQLRHIERLNRALDNASRPPPPPPPPPSPPHSAAR